MMLENILTMIKRIALISAILLLPLVGCSDDKTTANKLLVETSKLLKSADDATSGEEQKRLLEEALGILNEIVKNYSSTDLAVKLSSGQSVGRISLAGVTNEIEAAGHRIKRKAREAKEEELLKNTIRIPYNPTTKNSGVFLIDKAWPLPKSDTEGLQTLVRAAKDGNIGAQNTLGIYLVLRDGQRNTAGGFYCFPDEGLFWLILARKNGHVFATETVFNLGGAIFCQGNDEYMERFKKWQKTSFK